MKKMSMSQKSDCRSLRYGVIVPLALLVASFVSGCFSYSKAKRVIAEDLNDAMITLVSENSERWTRQDTIAALRQMHETTHKPVIYEASDVSFRHEGLKDEAYFVLALVDKKNVAPKIKGDKIASDSIVLVPESSADGLAIQVQGFADCSMASVFAVSDQRLPGVMLAFAMLSMVGVFVRRRNNSCRMETVEGHVVTVDMLEGVRLTPMQCRLTQMLIDAPSQRVDKASLCLVLWGNKSNAEESLYTLVRRTKVALADVGVEIICNRGDSYELRVSG